MRRIWAVALLLGSLLCLSAPADAVEVGIRGEYWFPKISGNGQTTTSGVPNTPYDLQSTLGLQDKNFPFGEAFLRLGRFTIRAGYTQVRYDGQSTLTQDFVFNGQTYTANIPITSQLELKMVDAQLQFDLLRPDAGVSGFNLGLILGGKYVDESLQVSSSQLPAVNESYKLPIPVVGVAAGVGLFKDLIRVDARGVGLAYSGNHGYDVDAYLSVIPFPFVRLQGGYRYLDVKVDESELILTVKLKGPYAGLQISF